MKVIDNLDNLPSAALDSKFLFVMKAKFAAYGHGENLDYGCFFLYAA